MFILKGNPYCFFSKKSTFRPIFEKCRRSSVILKIVGATLQLDQNINPQDICPDNFSFVYKYIWVYCLTNRAPIWGVLCLKYILCCPYWHGFDSYVIWVHIEKCSKSGGVAISPAESNLVIRNSELIFWKFNDLPSGFHLLKKLYKILNLRCT